MLGRMCCLWLLLPLVAGCARTQGDEDNAMPFVLAADEIAQARRLAEVHIPGDTGPNSPLERVYFIKAELLPDSQAESAQRQVMVTHYRYRDDETIHTMVDLVQHQVLKVEKFHHFPTALSVEERQRAEELARRDPRLQDMLKSQPTVRLQLRPLQVADPAEPYFGHRLVHLLLTRANEQLGTYVLVDLHTETVHLQ